METTMAANLIVAQESRWDALGADLDFETDADDSVREAFEFLGTMGLNETDSSSIAVDLIELS
jgi:hypothetical protein